MFEAMKEAFELLDQLTFGLGRLILMIIPLSLVLRAALNLAHALCTEKRIIEVPNRSEQIRSEQIRSEPIRADPPKVDLKKDIDSDLKKYFNYNVER